MKKKPYGKMSVYKVAPRSVSIDSQRTELLEKIYDKFKRKARQCGCVDKEEFVCYMRNDALTIVKKYIDTKKCLMEYVISEDPELAYEWVKLCCDGRCRLVEPGIMKSAKYSVMYAKNILKRRWLEAEAKIKLDMYYRALYNAIFECEI